MPIQPNDIANILLLGEPVNSQPPGTTPNPYAPIQHWDGRQLLPPGMQMPNGVVPYACLDPNTGALMFAVIPASQYYGPPNIPISGQPSVGLPAQTVNQPPVDVSKYNALAAEHEKVVVTLFGEQIQPTDPPPAATTGSSDPTLQQVAADTAAIRSGLNTLLGLANKPAV